LPQDPDAKILLVFRLDASIPVRRLFAVRAHRQRNPQRGGSRISTLITFAVIAFAVFIIWKVAPPYMNNYQLQDSMNEEARFAVVNRKGGEDVHADVMKKINELGIPATDKDVTVTTNPTSTQISVHYSVPVDLKVYQFTLDFSPTADGRTM
jgi:large-conductance mechanosensitive channel